MDLIYFAKDKRTICKETILKICAIVFYFLFMKVLVRPFASFYADKVIKNDVDINIKLVNLQIGLQYIIYIPILIFSLIFLRHEIKESIKCTEKRKVSTFFLTTLLGIFLCYLANFFGNLISGLFSNTIESTNQAEIVSIYSYPKGAFIIPDVCLIGPIVEELVFRGAMLKGMKELKVHPVVCVFISSLFFGFMHVVEAGEYSLIFPYLFMGLVLGFIYIKSNSLIESCFIHILMNSISTSLIYIMLLRELIIK